MKNVYFLRICVEIQKRCNALLLLCVSACVVLTSCTGGGGGAAGGPFVPVPTVPFFTCPDGSVVVDTDMCSAEGAGITANVASATRKTPMYRGFTGYLLKDREPSSTDPSSGSDGDESKNGNYFLFAGHGYDKLMHWEHNTKLTTKSKVGVVGFSVGRESVDNFDSEEDSKFIPGINISYFNCIGASCVTQEKRLGDEAKLGDYGYTYYEYSDRVIGLPNPYGGTTSRDTDSGINSNTGKGNSYNLLSTPTAGLIGALAVESDKDQVYAAAGLSQNSYIYSYNIGVTRAEADHSNIPAFSSSRMAGVFDHMEENGVKIGVYDYFTDLRSDTAFRNARTTGGKEYLYGLAAVAAIKSSTVSSIGTSLAKYLRSGGMFIMPTGRVAKAASEARLSNVMFATGSKDFMSFATAGYIAKAYSILKNSREDYKTIGGALLTVPVVALKSDKVGTTYTIFDRLTVAPGRLKRFAISAPASASQVIIVPKTVLGAGLPSGNWGGAGLRAGFANPKEFVETGGQDGYNPSLQANAVVASVASGLKNYLTNTLDKEISGSDIAHYLKFYAKASYGDNSLSRTYSSKESYTAGDTVFEGAPDGTLPFRNTSYFTMKEENLQSFMEDSTYDDTIIQLFRSEKIDFRYISDKFDTYDVGARLPVPKGVGPETDWSIEAGNEWETDTNKWLSMDSAEFGTDGNLWNAILAYIYTIDPVTNEVRTTAEDENGNLVGEHSKLLALMPFLTSHDIRVTDAEGKTIAFNEYYVGGTSYLYDFNNLAYESVTVKEGDIQLAETTGGKNVYFVCTGVTGTACLLDPYRRILSNIFGWGVLNTNEMFDLTNSKPVLFSNKAMSIDELKKSAASLNSVFGDALESFDFGKSLAASLKMTNELGQSMTTNIDLSKKVTSQARQSLTRFDRHIPSLVSLTGDPYVSDPNTAQSVPVNLNLLDNRLSVSFNSNAASNSLSTGFNLSSPLAFDSMTHYADVSLGISGASSRLPAEILSSFDSNSLQYKTDAFGKLFAPDVYDSMFSDSGQENNPLYSNLNLSFDVGGFKFTVADKILSTASLSILPGSSGSGFLSSNRLMGMSSQASNTSGVYATDPLGFQWTSSFLSLVSNGINTQGSKMETTVGAFTMNAIVATGEVYGSVKMVDEISQNSLASMEVVYSHNKSKYFISSGALNESDGLLGSTLSGMFSLPSGSSTTFGTAGFSQAITDTVFFNASYSYGVTNVNLDSTFSAWKNFDKLHSRAYKVGLMFSNFYDGILDISVASPLKIVSGSAEIGSNSDISTLSLVPTGTQRNYSVMYSNIRADNNRYFSFGVTYMTEPANIQNEPSRTYLVAKFGKVL